MMQNTYYIPINSGSLAHYFSKAIILPAKYFTNKPEDIQNKLEDSILISESKWVKNCDCSIEVVLTSAEIKDLNKVSDHFFLYNVPIPISRVKSICFLDSKQKETTIWNINSGAAFIPENIVIVEMDRNIEEILDIEFKRRDEFKSGIELADKIKRFDIILGGFAFMRLGGHSFMNYSANYFSTLSYFNKLIEEQTNYSSREKGLNFSNKYVGLFSKHESEWTKWQQYIYNNLDSQDIEILAGKEGEKIEKKLGLIKIDSINPSSHLYELAVLATYGDRKNKSTDNLVTDLNNGTISAEKTEDVSLLFGLNNGYSKLRNRYKGVGKDISVKFTLESKLDYYIIESIYQFVFNNSKANYAFDYIDSWCPVSKPIANTKGFETYMILDTTIIAKKKKTPSEFFWESHSGEIYSTVAKSISQWLPPYLKIDENEAVLYFEKHLRKTLSVSVEALQKKIESEFEENFEAQKLEVSGLHQMELNKLNAEISNLREENKRLSFRGNESMVKEPSTVQLGTPDSSIKKADLQQRDFVNTVVEPKVEITENYYSMSLQELQKIAKDKKIKGASKIKNREEIISLITKPAPTLL